jgi:hypothetical protein
LIRRARYILAAAGSAAILAGGMALASAGAASAATLPSCAGGTNCTSGPFGVAGYYGADDNHTHYRFVQTVTVATPQLVNLNGTGDNEGAVGASLCDPNTGQVAQVSLGFNGVGYQIAYDVGRYFTDAAEPCVQASFAHINPFKSGTLLDFPGVNAGDKIYLAIYYTPGGHHFHQISFGACDITQGVCRQAYSNSRYALNFWEFGIGAFSQRQFLTAPALNLLDNFSSNNVTCYSCAGAVPITSVAPVNPFAIGGLYEAQYVNGSSQVTMSPNDSLSSATDTFNVYNGSTSA